MNLTEPGSGLDNLIAEQSREIAATSLTENDIVEAVCRYIQAQGMTIESRCSTKQQGYDIVAIHPKTGRRLIIEAKGATSASETSARFGKGFSTNQVRSHVARAFYTAASTLQKEAGKADAAIALPDTENHRHFVQNIESSLKNLGIAVFWVNSNGSIDAENWNS
ncbi:MAG TPA: hypothetical protein PLB35_08185 [Myxococcota bacterium]|nr:hypothetical protein [Myxococcota bacterium]HOH77219.1 hypothetical protein [Myxococcota bacterium]